MENPMNTTRYLPAAALRDIRANLEPVFDGKLFWSPNSGVTKYVADSIDGDITVSMTCQDRRANLPVRYVTRTAVITDDGRISGHDGVIRDVLITFRTDGQLTITINPTVAIAA